jgi:GAF domain-containing protein
MKKRSRAGVERHRTSKPTRQAAPKVAAARSSTLAVGLEAEVARLTRELNEAREQQTATSEVLHVISSFPGDLQSVFKAMLENAVSICDARVGNIYRREEDDFILVASHNLTAFAGYRSQSVSSTGTSLLGRVLKTKGVLHVADLAVDRSYTARNPLAVAAVELGGVRTILAVPMLKMDELIGAFTVSRQEVRPFTDKQIELVKNFAAQAVIAIENAQLLNELRRRTTDLTERTADLTEALEQQTATSEVLQVISSSPGDLQPVFAAMLEKAVRVCDATFGDVYRPHGDTIQLVAMQNTPPTFAEALKQMTQFRPSSSVGLRMMATKSAVQVTDLAADPDYVERRSPEIIAAVELGGVRTVLAVPMLKENELIGAFILNRQEVRPFTDRQVALVTNFAAQAVIAIENARLLNKLRQSLEQQTATSQVLQVISSSPGDLEQVFATMLENATRICEAKFGALYLSEGDGFRATATHNAPPDYEKARSAVVYPPPSTTLWRAASSKQAVQIADARLQQGYIERDPFIVSATDLGGYRSVLSVPMLHENELVGVITIFRQEVRPFTEEQISLVRNFAAQAVIAIENARLLNELRQRTTDLTEALEQQTATSDVLGIISSSPSDLQPMFQAILENATHICEAQFGFVHRYDDGLFQPTAQVGAPTELVEFHKNRGAFRPDVGGMLDRMIRTKEVGHTSDIAAEAFPVAAAKIAGARSTMAVPMLKDDNLVGALVIYRQEVRPFTDKQIALVRNFAAQAAIAIENARLLRELRERTEEVVKLNEQLELRVADQVGEIERMGRLRRFLPPQVADLIVASGSEKQLESHRREITALFCDLRGFTGFTESADAEDVMALLRDYHAAVGELIIKYSGTLERYAGDGVMVVFNDPVPVEKPALQAVLMALETRDAIGALTEKWGRLGHDIGFGIGIAHGFATLGTIGFEGRFDYAAIGTVSNVASRLCDEAKPGQILISPRVLMAVEDAVTVEPVGEFVLKGIRRPLAAYNVLSIAPGN